MRSTAQAPWRPTGRAAATAAPAAPLRNTTAFLAQAGICFAVAALAIGICITYLPVDRWIRGFLALGALLLVSSSFALAKCVRDHQEATQNLSALGHARLEGMLAGRDARLIGRLTRRSHTR